jgi:hypothetical protein
MTADFSHKYKRVGNLTGCPERNPKRAEPVIDAEGKST